MNISNKSLSFALSLLLVATAPAIAQQSNPSSNAPSQSTPPVQGSGQADQPPSDAPAVDQGAPGEACWQQAGVPKSTMQTRRSIMQNAKTQIEKVESDASLTPQQQNQQARLIRQNARRQIASILTPQQERALRQCQRQGRANRQPTDSSGSSAAPSNL
jgi:hypothetical protein